MRVLGVLAAWGVLAVLATMCFALGGSLGYRRGVKDTLAQIRDRRTGKTGCRPLPANHLRRRTTGHARPGARSRRARWRPRPTGAPVAGSGRSFLPSRSDPRVTALAAAAAAILLVGVPSTAIGATTAQPGESLYTVRRNLERVRVALATGAEDDTEVHVELAAARLVDLQGLVGNPDVGPDVIADVSLDLGVHAEAASRRLTGVEDDNQRSELGQRLQHVVGTQVEIMDNIVTLDCSEDVDVECETLSETRDGTVALRTKTEADVAIAQAGPEQTITATAVDPGPTDAPVAEASEPTGQADPGDDPSPAPTEAAADTAPDDEPSEGASEAATGATPTPTPSAGPTQRASTTPAAAERAAESETPTAGKAGGANTSEASAAGTGQ